MKTIFKNIKFIGTFCLFGVFLVMADAFYSAYFSPSKSVTIFINVFNEANIEAFIVFPFVLLIGLFSLILNYIDLKK